MKIFAVLLKSIFINAFRSEGKKKKKQLNGLLSMLISGGVFGLLFVFMTIYIGPIFKSMDLEAEYLTMIFLSSQFIVLIFGTVLMVNIMFFSKDAEMLLSLPIKTNVIFVAKMIYVYLSELMLSAFIVIVTGITFGIVCGFGISYYLLLLPAILIVPMVPLIISALLSMPIMFVISFFKNKSILSIILLTGGFTIFMYFYLNFFGSMGKMGNESFNLPGDAIKQAMQYMFPVISLARIVTLTSADFLFDILIVLAATVGLFLITLLISTFTFKRGMASQLEEAKSNNKGPVEFVVNTAYKSFLIKEVKELIRNPGLAFYCIFQIIMAPIMIIFYGTANFSGNTSADAALNSTINQGFAFFFATLMVIGINYTALSSISREGVNFNMSKTLPAPYSYQIRVKVLLSDIVLFAGLLLSFLSMVLILKINIIQALLFFGFGLILGNGLNHLLTYLDAKDPKLDWESITVALKNSKASLISVLISVAAGLPLTAGMVIIPLLLSGTVMVIVFAVFWAVFYALAILLNFLFRKLLKNNIERLIAQHE